MRGGETGGGEAHGTETRPVERLQKVLAAAGIASRRGSEALIASGRVTVDGVVARVGQSVDPRRQRIAVDGHRIPSPDAPRLYWVLNKPAGVVSTVRDPHAERTVLEFLPSEVRSAARLYPVGRLDEGSEGLLLLTNDGAWADLLLHPRFGVEREYMVGLGGSLRKPQRLELRNGIELEEGIARFDHLEDATPAEVRRLLELLEPPHERVRWYRVVLAQGWKRQIRRMFGAVDAPVQRLVRTRIGTLRLAGLLPGEVRELRRQEVVQLASCAHAERSMRPVRPPRPADGREATRPAGARDPDALGPAGAGD